MPIRKTYTPHPAFQRVTRAMANNGADNAREQGNRDEAIRDEGRPYVNLPKFDNICERFNPKTMDAHTWLHKFLAIAVWANWSNEQMCFFFGLHLLSDAYDWFANLPDAVTHNFNEIKEQFLARFSLHGSSKWSIIQEIYEMKQKSDQPVQDFIQQVQMKARLIDLPEDQVIGALMKGFLPNIRADLIRSNIQTLPEVIKEASISETANKIKVSQSDSILSEEHLIKAIQTAMSISHIQPSEPQNKSNFRSGRPNYSYSRQQNTSHRPQNAHTRPRVTVNHNYICFRCERQGHHYHNQCPFINAVCYGCSKRGHIERACKAKQQQ